MRIVSKQTNSHCGKLATHLLKSLFDTLFSIRYVEAEDLSAVYYQGDNAHYDKHGDEQRRDRIKACPAVKLDQQC